MSVGNSTERDKIWLLIRNIRQSFLEMYFLWILETRFFVNGDNVREEQCNE